MTLSRRVLLGTVAAATVLPASRGRAQQEPICIGMLNDQSGLYRDFGGPTSALAARMAVEDFGGNVFGRRIEVIDADHQNKADLASAIARGWFDRQGVTAIADLTNSAVALAVQQLARERGKITLLTGPATTKLTNEECSPTGFHWVFDTYSQATGTAKAMLAEGGKPGSCWWPTTRSGTSWRTTCGMSSPRAAARWLARCYTRSPPPISRASYCRRRLRRRR